MLDQKTTIQSYVKGAVFESAENNLVVNYHADGLESDTAMDDNMEEEDEAYAWPSETFKTLRWLTVQLMAFDDALPCSWHDYHEGKMADQEPTLMHLKRMLERTASSGNGAKMLEHVDETIRGLLQTFCEEFGEEPLNVIPDWWSQSSRVPVSQYLHGAHPDQPDSMLSTLKESYALKLKAQEARYAARLARSIKGLHQTAMPYRESYLALAICARLASMSAVRAAIFDPNTNLLRNWVKVDSTLAEAVRSRKTHSPKWHRYSLAQGCSLTAFDTIFEQRRSKISQALLEVILPLSIQEMISIFNRLNGSNTSLDIDCIAFHWRSFVTASDHVDKWIGKDTQVGRGELGLSLVWNFYKDTAAHIALIGNGPYVAWESLKLLEQYTAPEAVLNVDTRAVVEDASANSRLISPL
ncbi:hypothetical protein QFC21_004983 [Naganishia friedmannii]|uniref:Uncharacterized protein n=1 Tax=Naganishia friedmannii TaxID=89922 RepID=A0ACC2VBG5_9TREE|nr:hypothetical protein QFC21_004983 [Naganishia friedmannii]